LPLREEIYRLYEKAIEIKPLIKERHAQDAIKGLISSFDKQVRLCAAVEENERNKIEAAKKIAEEKEKDEQELEKEKKDKRRKSKTARKSSDKTVEEEIQEGVEQMTLPAEEEEDKDDAGASSSGAEQPVPAKKAKKTPPATKRSSQRSKSSQSGNTSTDMESPKVFRSPKNDSPNFRLFQKHGDQSEHGVTTPRRVLSYSKFTFHCPIYSTHSVNDLNGNHSAQIHFSLNYLSLVVSNELRMSWYKCFYKIGLHETEQLLMLSGKDGSFLVRPSSSSPGQKTLSYRDGNEVSHIKIMWNGDSYG